MKYLAPTEHVAVLSWITGWLNMVGTTAGTASTQYGAAQMLLAAISIGTSPAYEQTQGHVVGVMAGLTIIQPDSTQVCILRPSRIAAGALSTYILCFLFNLVLVFCMSDPTRIARASHGQPAAQIFSDVLGRGPAVFLTVMGFVVLKLLWTYASLCVLINLIGLASQVAIGAVFNVCAVALSLSYVVPIVCKLVSGKFERGPWHLCVWSLPVNVWACGWNILMSAISLLPIELPVIAGNMNYAVAVLVLVLSFSVIYWFAAGRRFYTGPRTHTHIENGVAVVDEVPPSDEKAPLPAT
ncbi:hypothetical protein GE09DRAFT_1048531 [Coniochaeta sp. 2T2.1]|nr:hypothetical protein GE09DRAFT_1048531 [Coniochaeta sp. 2T2.1]